MSEVSERLCLCLCLEGEKMGFEFGEDDSRSDGGEWSEMEGRDGLGSEKESPRRFEEWKWKFKFLAPSF